MRVYNQYGCWYNVALFVVLHHNKWRPPNVDMWGIHYQYYLLNNSVPFILKVLLYSVSYDDQNYVKHLLLEHNNDVLYG